MKTALITGITGQNGSYLSEFLLAFSHAGLNWKKHVKIDKNFYRPAGVCLLLGDYSKAKRKLS